MSVEILLLKEIVFSNGKASFQSKVVHGLRKFVTSARRHVHVKFTGLFTFDNMNKIVKLAAILKVYVKTILYFVGRCVTSIVCSGDLFTDNDDNNNDGNDDDNDYRQIMIV